MATTRPARRPSAVERAAGIFRRTFGRDPTVVVRSPGRVNLIGDHTDHNDGLAMPMAIDRELAVAAARRRDAAIEVVSELDGRRRRFDVAGIRAEDRWPGWTLYAQGVLRHLWAPGEGTGFDAAVASDLPAGGGLSSSAALEMGIARLAAWLTGRPWQPAPAAAAGTRAENEWVGVPTGTMDQIAVAHGRRGAALVLDCAAGTWRYVPVPASVDVLVLDTGARRALVESAYDARRRECAGAARRLGVGTLRSLSSADLGRVAGLPEPLAARARHVVTENDRVRRVEAALAEGRLDVAGRALAESHRSLAEDFEVSGTELDTMAAIAAATPGVLGARMTGGGFAGAVVALARAGAVDVGEVIDRYRAVHDLPAHGRVVRAADGASLAIDEER